MSNACAWVVRYRTPGGRASRQREQSFGDDLNEAEDILLEVEHDKKAHVGHGVNCLASDALQADIRARGLGLTVCPVSNSYVRAARWPDDIRELLDRVLRVTVNSDDPAYFGGCYVTEVILRQREAAPLSRDELVRLQRNAFEIA